MLFQLSDSALVIIDTEAADDSFLSKVRIVQLKVIRTLTLLLLALSYSTLAMAEETSPQQSLPVSSEKAAQEPATGDESHSKVKEDKHPTKDSTSAAEKDEPLKASAATPSSSKSGKSKTVVKARGKSKTGNQEHSSRGIAPCLAWVDRTKPIQAVIVCVHGLGLHNGTYEAFGKRMAELGYAAYAIDVRGFGAWMQAKGRDVVDFESCLNDVRTTLKVVKRAHPGLPVFLLGESMGGAIALRVTSLYPDLVNGLISSVPAGDRFKQAKTGLKVALHLLKSPNKPINVGEGVVRQATQNEELRKNWLEDPLARVNLTPKELVQFQNFMNGNHEAAKKIVNTPVLIVQGCQDKLVRPEGTVELFNRLGTDDRQIVLIPNGEHLIFEEAQFTEQEITTVNSWMTARLQKPQSIEESQASGEK